MEARYRRKSKYSHLNDGERQRLIKDEKNQRAIRQRQELTQNFDNLAALLNFNLNQPFPERPELLQLAAARIKELRKQIKLIQCAPKTEEPWRIQKSRNV
eukprot:UN13131